MAAPQVTAERGLAEHIVLPAKFEHSIRSAQGTKEIQGGQLALVHHRGDMIVRGRDGDRAVPADGFISLAAGESIHDGTQSGVDARRGFKIATAIVLTALAAGTVGYLADELWFRNRIVTPWGGMYGGYGGYGGGAW